MKVRGDGRGMESIKLHVETAGSLTVNVIVVTWMTVWCAIDPKSFELHGFERTSHSSVITFHKCFRMAWGLIA